MHRVAYISLFTFLGIILSFVVHGVIEMSVIALLVRDFARYGLGLSWTHWYAIHHTGSLVLLIAGVLFGFWQGKHWYKIIYKNRVDK
jgi:hypothetical protein